jgi:nucleotide-binding universal stress UspA family protein
MAVAYDAQFLLRYPDEPDALAAARRHASNVVRRLTDVPLIATPHVEESEPKRLLLEEARRWKTDAIFVGAKGHSRLERFLLGSVSAAVAARAPCTVEVVRPSRIVPPESGR